MKKIVLCIILSTIGLCTFADHSANNRNATSYTSPGLWYSASPSSASPRYYISSECYGAISKEALNALVRNLSKNDIASAKKQLARGELVPLDKGVSLEMIDYGFANCKVRIASGKYKGKVVYVVTEFIGKR